MGAIDERACVGRINPDKWDGAGDFLSSKGSPMTFDTTYALEIMAIHNCSVTFDRSADFGSFNCPDGKNYVQQDNGKDFRPEMPRSMRDALRQDKKIELQNRDESGREIYRLTRSGRAIGLS